MHIYNAKMTKGKGSYDFLNSVWKSTAHMKSFGFHSLGIHNPVIPHGCILFILSI